MSVEVVPGRKPAPARHLLLFLVVVHVCRRRHQEIANKPATVANLARLVFLLVVLAKLSVPVETARLIKFEKAFS